MSNQFKVNTTSLNLRSAPIVAPSNIIVALPDGQVVTKLSVASNNDWWEISTAISGSTITGFVSHRFLISLDGSLAGIVANGETLTIDELKANKQLVLEIQKRLRNLGLYPGGQWIDGNLGNEGSRTRQGLDKFFTAMGLALPSKANAINPISAQALLDTQQITSVLDKAKNQTAVLAELTDIQSDTPVPNGYFAYLDRTIKNSPFELEVKNYPTYLAQQPDGTNIVSYGKTFTFADTGKTVTFSDYPSRGDKPTIDGKGLDFLDSSIDHACVCVGSFVAGEDEIKTHWLGRKSLVPVQFLSSTKFIAVLNTICQLNKDHPNCDVDNCVIGVGVGGKRYAFPALVEDMLTYAAKIASSNSIAAMFKRFSTRKGLEDWVKGVTDNQNIEFRGYYGENSFIDSPNLIDTTLGNPPLLKSASEVGGGPNSISAYDLVRLISMLGWHLHLPRAAQLPDLTDFQWISLESVVRAMGVDTARYVDVALETLGLVNMVSEPVVISKLGLGNSALTYVAHVKLVDNRQVPSKLRTLAMALWTSPGSNTKRDNNMAAAVTEIIRRVFTEELV